MKWENILVNAKAYADYYETHKFKYKNNSIKTTWPGAKKVKYSNCMAYVSYILQACKLLKSGQMIYCNGKSQIVYKGTGTRAQVKKNFTIIKVNRTPTEYKAKMKPGDICMFKSHTCIYAGSNDKGMIWWDAGKSATSTKKAGGTYVNIHRAQKFRGRDIKWILRAKE